MNSKHINKINIVLKERRLNLREHVHLTKWCLLLQHFFFHILAPYFEIVLKCIHVKQDPSVMYCISLASWASQWTLQARHIPEWQPLWQPFCSGPLISVLPQAEQSGEGRIQRQFKLIVQITFQTSQTEYLTLLPSISDRGISTDSGTQFNLSFERRGCTDTL